MTIRDEHSPSHGEWMMVIPLTLAEDNWSFGGNTFIYHSVFGSDIN